jgi:putative DNA primase/helicase
MQRWRATINGLEALAAIHNDTLLCLDELGQIDPFEAGEAAYLLAHGTGKTRANQFGLSKKKSAWRLLFLSTGETGLAQHMLEAGKKVRAGQEVRIVEIPADTGKHGIFESLHHFEEAKAFAEALDESCKEFYGTAGRQFILSLLQAFDPTIAAIKVFRHEFIKQYHHKQADGQVGRVLNRFALIAAAGEIATSFGITDWQQGKAIEASLSCFNAWLKTRGGIGSQEERMILSQVHRYFEQHGESRFTLWDAPPEQKTINRAGFRRYMQGGIEFYVFAEAFRMEICEGLDPTQVAKVCARHGLLMLSSEESCTRSERLPGMEHTVRCYRFTSKVLGEN